MSDDLTKDRLLELVIAALPGPTPISQLDSTRETRAIRFTWQHTRFRVTNTLFVEEVEGVFLKRSTAAALLEALLREVYARKPSLCV